MGRLIIPPELKAKEEQFWENFKINHKDWQQRYSELLFQFCGADFTEEEHQQWRKLWEETWAAQPLDVQLERQKELAEERIQSARLKRMDAFREILRQTDPTAPLYGDVFLARFEDWDRTQAK